MDCFNGAEKIKRSIIEQEKLFNETLILNPVENVPNPEILEPCSSFLHGLYNTDSLRNSSQKINTKIQFSGRTQITEDVNDIYNEWAKLLKAEKLSMRYLSGLHAHIVILMSVSEIGQRIMALPEKAGGHLSSYAIIKRLGLKVKDIPYDSLNKCIDREKCIAELETFKPDIIFVDRSEGLIYEDFSWLGNIETEFPCYKIFDASQYLTNIICKDYINPFDMGFDLIISTMHKNLPGPQRALVCSKKNDEMWERLKSGTSAYVSNMHVFSIYSAGLLLKDIDKLKHLSKNMLVNASLLDLELQKKGLPVVDRNCNKSNSPTHHCWICFDDKKTSFELFENLERIGLMTNYRLLPYNLGYGLRLGLSGATQSGLETKDIPDLANIIANAYNFGYSSTLFKETKEWIKTIKDQVNAHD